MERRRGCVYRRDGLAFHIRSEARSILRVLPAGAEGVARRKTLGSENWRETDWAGQCVPLYTV